MPDVDNATGEESVPPTVGGGAPPEPTDLPRPPSRSRQRFWRWARTGLLILLLATGVSLLPPVQNWGSAGLTRLVSPPTPTALPLDAQWRVLEARPVQLSRLAPGAPCPTTPHHMAFDYIGAGSGPVYAVWNPGEGRPDGELPYGDAARFNGGQSSGWGGTRATWVVDARYRDAVLIRGRQLDGDHLIRFNGGLAQANDRGSWLDGPMFDELRLAGSTFSRPEQPYSVWLSYTRLQAPGCYAYHVDGLTFHDAIVFQAVASQ